jgi:hypothetical protein
VTQISHNINKGMIATVEPLALHLYQENLTRNYKLLNIRITDKYILHMHALHIQMAKCSLLMTYQWACNKSNTTDTEGGTGTAYV